MNDRRFSTANVRSSKATTARRSARSTWSCTRTLALFWACAGWLALPEPSMAQAQEWREAPIIEPQDQRLPARPVALPPDPRSVVEVFHDACIDHEGQPAAVIDWALAHGYQPLDSMVLGAQELLGGAAGTVLAAPLSAGTLMLAVTDEPRCLVWAEKTVGPELLKAFQTMVSGLAFRGAKVQSQLQRNLNAGGAWRNQAQWRYRRVGGDRDFGLGSATTLAPAPSTQLLNFAPWPAVPSRDPDGQPRR
jgi:hypothetical protein